MKQIFNDYYYGGILMTILTEGLLYGHGISTDIPRHPETTSGGMGFADIKEDGESTYVLTHLSK